jgi:hypothetical protein
LHLGSEEGKDAERRMGMRREGRALEESGDGERSGKEVRRTRAGRALPEAAPPPIGSSS